MVFHRLFKPFAARFVRVNVRSWYGHIALRVELYGCSLGKSESAKKPLSYWLLTWLCQGLSISVLLPTRVLILMVSLSEINYKLMLCLDILSLFFQDKKIILNLEEASEY